MQHPFTKCFIVQIPFSMQKCIIVFVLNLLSILLESSNIAHSTVLVCQIVPGLFITNCLKNTLQLKLGLTVVSVITIEVYRVLGSYKLLCGKAW